MFVALKYLFVMTVLTGVIYPLLINCIAHVTMPFQAQGSLSKKDDKIIGSLLIAQSTTAPEYFWPRPSATEYKIPSGGSNLGPTSQKLQKIVAKRREVLQKAAKDSNLPISAIPPELLYASASGLDPHISLQTAYFQMQRIAKARSLASTTEIKKIIDNSVEGRQWALFGPHYVNVLHLNTVLDQTFTNSPLSGIVEH